MDFRRGVQFQDSFIAVGGSHSGLDMTDEILFYNPTNDTWDVMPQRLAEKKAVYTAFFVPDSAVNCD